MSAASLGWGSPGHPAGGLSRVTWSNGVSLHCSSLLAPLVKALGDETIRRGYNLRPGVCGGYANRPIRGGTTPSYHAYGAAIDLNWDRNPMGARTWEMPEWVGQLWESHGFTWGGRWTTRPDAMHFQVKIRPNQVNAMLANLHGTPHRTMAPAPSRIGAHGPHVVSLQQMCRWFHWGDVGNADGIYGSRTATGVRDLQRAVGSTPDGWYGPTTARKFQAWLDAL